MQEPYNFEWDKRTGHRAFEICPISLWAAAAAVVGSYISSRGSKKAAKAQGAGNAYTEQARLDATKVANPQNIQALGNWMFPGLLPDAPQSSIDAMRGTAVQPGGRGGFGSGSDSRFARFPVGGLMLGALNNFQNAREKRLSGRTLGYGGAETSMTGPSGGGLKHGQGMKSKYSNSTKGTPSNTVIPGKAKGGPVAAQQPYVVGEKGPEVMVPQTDGAIIPNATTGSEVGAPGPPGVMPTPDPSPLPIAPEKEKQEQGQSVQVTQNYQPDQGTGTPGYLGQASMDHATNFLANPGELSTIQYERAQEQANVGLNTSLQGMMGGLTGMGIDPRSPMAKYMEQGVINQSNKLRNEASRDLSLQQEALKRQDIQAGMTAYQNFLSQVFNLVGMEAGVIGGGAYSNIANPINPYANIGSAIAEGGLMYANYKADKKE